MEKQGASSSFSFWEQLSTLSWSWTQTDSLAEEEEGVGVGSPGRGDTIKHADPAAEPGYHSLLLLLLRPLLLPDLLFFSPD